MKKDLKVLLATDYSEAAMNAERYAVRFSIAANAELSLIHAYSIPLVSAARPLEFIKTRSGHRQSELEKLEHHRDSILWSLNIDPNDLNCECVVYEGRAGKEICKEAKISEIDFIVVGTHGAGGFSEILLGTHSWDVIKKATVPVFAIPINGLYTGIRHIVFATEERAGEIPPIHFLAEFAKRINAEITILHITDETLTKEYETRMLETFSDGIMAKTDYDRISMHIASYEDVGRGLDDFCMKTNADLLVMSPKRPSLFEKIFMPDLSMTRRMSLHTRVPLLAIPDNYHPENNFFWELLKLDELHLDN